MTYISLYRYLFINDEKEREFKVKDNKKKTKHTHTQKHIKRPICSNRLIEEMLARLFNHHHQDHHRHQQINMIESMKYLFLTCNQIRSTTSTKRTITPKKKSQSHDIFSSLFSVCLSLQSNTGYAIIST